ncbi:MAG: preprotein translocase subunit YajC [Firmicutes bacterium]|nr:preprotein translocase subunit YajC [Bacillota bacterium]
MNAVEIVIISVLVLLFVGMIVLQTRRRRSVMNEQMSMIDKLRPGMRVKTVAGVIGRIKEIREENANLKTVLLETGHGSHTSFALYDIQAILAVLDEPGANITVSNVTMEETPTNAPTFEEMQAQINDGFNAEDFVKKSNSTRTPKKK